MMDENRRNEELEELCGSDLVSSFPVAAKKRCPKLLSLDEEEFMSLLHGSDPVKIELNRLENEVKDKDRELADAHGEIKSLRLIERAKDKALAEVTEELEKMSGKWQASEAALEDKNLEVKKITDEKKEALSAQFAAEATLRRVHAAQKDEELPPLEAILSPLEAEIKFLRQELTKVQDDNKALERLTKSKEVALLEAEREVQLANVKAALVDDLLNKNQELTKQNDICQEEYKILDRMHRQKVAEVEKLGQTIRELEEALLSGAAAANAVRDYQRQVSELKGEKKTLERTLSRVMVTESRVATAIANEWKDANDKVIPAKQWNEERRILMGEMQQLRDKLTIAERAAKAEAQLKERFQFRLKVVEDGLKCSLRSGIRCEPRNTPNGLMRSLSVNGADASVSPLPSGNSMRKSSPAVKSTPLSSPTSAILKHAKGTSKSFDGGRSTEYDSCRTKTCGGACSINSLREERDVLLLDEKSPDANKTLSNGRSSIPTVSMGEDFVSGVLYDILQKEVVCLRNACHEKDQCMKDKDNCIEALSKKVDTLTKAMEVETRKLRRENKEAGIPDGVLNVITGFGSTAGAALSSHMDVDTISFTGSTEVGRLVMEAAARSNLKPVSLELGGKSPLIIFNDADVNMAIDVAKTAIFYNKGEMCIAGSRVFVQEGIHDEFVKKIAESLKNWVVGDPFESNVNQGPQVDKKQFEKVLRYIEYGKRDGATLLAGGKPCGEKGYFIEPTIFTDVKEDMLIAKDEIFGPVMSLMKFKTIEEVIEKANNTIYGLAAGIITNDLNIANRVSRSIRAGIIWINCYIAFDRDCPYGGYKMSGFGRDLGLHALEKYLQVKTVITPIYGSPWL